MEKYSEWWWCGLGLANFFLCFFNVMCSFLWLTIFYSFSAYHMTLLIMKEQHYEYVCMYYLGEAIRRQMVERKLTTSQTTLK